MHFTIIIYEKLKKTLWLLVLVLWFVHILETVHRQRLKGMWKRYHLSIGKGKKYFSVQNGMYERVRPPAGASPWNIILLCRASLISPRDTKANKPLYAGNAHSAQDAVFVAFLLLRKIKVLSKG